MVWCCQNTTLKRNGHHHPLRSASSPLSDTHLVKYNCGQKPTVPKSHHSEGHAPLGCDCWIQECWKAGHCLLPPCTLSGRVAIFLAITITYFTRGMGIYQTAALGAVTAPSLLLVIETGLFRLSSSQLIILVLTDGLLPVGSLLGRQHKTS